MPAERAPSILPLELRGVSLEAPDDPGRWLIEQLDFTLEARHRTLILGPNGAGKSLTLRLCHGLVLPTRGHVRYRGPGAARANAAQAMVFQRPVLLRRSVIGNVRHALRLRRLPRPEIESRSRGALERIGLTGLAERSARTLSGGEQQRLALARAWALEPEILFLDEPTASLDPGATGAVEATVRAISDAGTKIVMTTHDLGQARRLADEVLFLHRGRLVEQAPADAFFDGPASDEARAFLKGDLFW